jgi:hypothetical protein
MRCLSNNTPKEPLVMSQFTPRIWVGLAASALVAGGLAACTPGGEGGETGHANTPAGAAGEAAAGESGSEGGAPAAAAGGETGEAGAANAYAGLDAANSSALRAAHLRGFLLIAQNAMGKPGIAEGEAGILVRQGILEVLDPQKASFDADGSIGRALDAYASALEGKGNPQATFAAADALLKGRIAAGTNPAEIVRRQLGIVTGLYAGVVKGADVDPVEYQHAMGAALSAQALLADGKDALSKKNAAAFAAATKEIDALVALFPAPVAPTAPTPPGRMDAQASRVILELTGL